MEEFYKKSSLMLRKNPVRSTETRVTTRTRATPARITRTIRSSTAGAPRTIGKINVEGQHSRKGNSYERLNCNCYYTNGYMEKTLLVRGHNSLLLESSRTIMSCVYVGQRGKEQPKVSGFTPARNFSRFFLHYILITIY